MVIFPPVQEHGPQCSADRRLRTAVLQYVSADLAYRLSDAPLHHKVGCDCTPVCIKALHECEVSVMEQWGLWNIFCKTDVRLAGTLRRDRHRPVQGNAAVRHLVK